MELLNLKSGSDIRGIAMGANSKLTPEIVKKISKSFTEMVIKVSLKANKKIKIAIGHDSRLTGPSLSHAAAKGIVKRGVNAVIVGLATTPSICMSTLPSTGEDSFDGAIMITASHHPSNMNGMKFFLPEGGLTSKDIENLLMKTSLGFDNLEPSREGNIYKINNFLDSYKNLLAGSIKEQLDTSVALPLLGLHVVVDAGNGAGGFYAKFLQDLGADTKGSQFLNPDGNFPNHPPNPENKEAMDSLSLAVKKHKADLGIIFDADCDRVAIVDSQGKIINRNRLIALVSAIILEIQPGATIVTDSVTSTGLAEFIKSWGGEHYRFKRGYRNVIDEAIILNETGINCPLAIETSGHAAFRDNNFVDDGMFLATKIITEAIRRKQEGEELTSLIDTLKEPKEEVEIRLKIKEKDFQKYGRECIEQVMTYGDNCDNWLIAPDNREGVRYSFTLQEDGLEEGWFLLRLSVHDPVLPLNIESDVEGGILKVLKQLIVPLKNSEGIDIKPITDLIENFS